MAENKVFGKFSKKTIGKSVDNVADYVDILSQMVVEYFSRRYKIEKKVDDIKITILKAMYSLKKEFMKSVIETLFLTTGLLALITGSILLMSKYVALEYILIFYGLIVSIAVLLRLKVDV